MTKTLKFLLFTGITTGVIVLIKKRKDVKKETEFVDYVTLQDINKDYESEEQKSEPGAEKDSTT